MIKNADKRGKGRPPIGEEPLALALTVRFPGPMMREIEAIRASRLDAPDKGQVIRELIAEAIEARRKRVQER